jgi:hypothetical protein
MVVFRVTEPSALAGRCQLSRGKILSPSSGCYNPSDKYDTNSRKDFKSQTDQKCFELDIYLLGLRKVCFVISLIC